MNTRRRELIKFAGLGTAGICIHTSSPTKVCAEGIANSRHTNPLTYDVKEFGATGDGTTIDSPAINRAIAAAAAAGGGIVSFPPGTYTSYSIRLKDNISLYLAQGATIIAAKTINPGNPDASYDAAEPVANPTLEQYQDFGHNHWHNSFIWGVGLNNISILGPGLIWGKGLSRGGRHDTPRAQDPGVGTKAIALKDCRNVLLQDFSILEGGHMGILATGVDNLTIDNLKIDTNRDGMDIDCCRNVRITNCSVNSPTDDAICAKSSLALGYARPTENVTISNCYVTGTYQMGTILDGTYKKFPTDTKVLRQGGIKCGSESNGGFRNIVISNCVLEGCRGVQLESIDGGIAEDICISNLTMRNIQMTPLFLRLGSRLRGPAGISTGKLRRILINNIVCSNADSRFCSIFSGVPEHCIEDVKISDIFIQHQGGASIAQATLRPLELESRRSDPNMFGPMPAQGFFLRHLRNLDMSHIEIAALAPDARPSFVLDDVKDADFLCINPPRISGIAIFALHNAAQCEIRFSRGLADTSIDKAVDKTIDAD